ncbi:aminoglycoside phosphotransferase family protein [Tenggerimyces flavus]|uniref:Aminoglycoside phosphotransferase family protein n=1 Tax=Tenggerimyces flavus TaxID=1708749 RepID=A0ABV7YR63_9ACTN|nr:aminoglycoside phosphotransferase family protein [Tenggerimyces flavus]MBM7786480.1 aminoglycoside phosphotransferase (APT) family kinase protein [Tenggerimyces flavus]
MDRSEITVDVAARLVAEQFPQWADLPVRPVKLNGWDNFTFRLGDAMSVRMPSGEGYVGQVAKEQRWLPLLASRLPVPIPSPVALGQPNAEYPWPWSVYRWIEGTRASTSGLTDFDGFAKQVAGFLTALQSIDGTDGPPYGQHSAERGGPVGYWDEWTRRSIEVLKDEIDAPAATACWETALASQWERPPVWVHGDLTASNLLVSDGALNAVIDFGCSCVGDPACDLLMAWNFFDDESARTFRDGLALDEATWQRGRGWALWKTLITIDGAREDGADPRVRGERMGWRFTPHEIVERILQDS